MNTMINKILFSAIFLFGFMSIVPNMIIGDTGTQNARRKSSIGLTGSLCLIIGGYMGVFYQVLFPIEYAVATSICGFVLQLCVITWL